MATILSAANLAQLDYDYGMLGNPRERGPLQQRLALLKQQHLELLTLLSRSHASLAATDELEAKLEAVAAEMTELESVLMPPLRKTA